MPCLVRHEDQKAVCHCLTAILNLGNIAVKKHMLRADVSNKVAERTLKSVPLWGQSLSSTRCERSAVCKADAGQTMCYEAVKLQRLTSCSTGIGCQVLLGYAMPMASPVQNL